MVNTGSCNTSAGFRPWEKGGAWSPPPKKGRVRGGGGFPGPLPWICHWIPIIPTASPSTWKRYLTTFYLFLTTFPSSKFRISLFTFWRLASLWHVNLMNIPDICRKDKFLQIPSYVPARRGEGERGEEEGREGVTLTGAQQGLVLKC